MLRKFGHDVVVVVVEVVEPESGRSLVDADVHRHRLQQRQHRRVHLRVAVTQKLQEDLEPVR